MGDVLGTEVVAELILLTPEKTEFTARNGTSMGKKYCLESKKEKTR